VNICFRTHTGVGDEVAAVLDLKTDRVARRLLIQQWTWIGQGARRVSAASRKRCTASSASSSTRGDPEGSPL
jgi:hypothetical protein